MFVVEMIEGVVEVLLLEDCSVDCVVVIWVFCSVLELEKVFVEIWCVFKLDGIFCFVEYGLVLEFGVWCW